MFAKCEYKECDNSSKCVRFLESQGAVMDYAAVCNESNDYKWFNKANVQIVKKEE